MLSTSSIAVTPTMVIADCSPAEKAQAQFLWLETLRLRDQGKVVIFFPQLTGTRMGAYHLRAMADSLSLSVQTPVYIHFDVERLAYRIGQIFDDYDRAAVSQSVFVYRADLQEEEYASSVSVAFDSPSATIQEDDQASMAASQYSPQPSGQKLAKIPKPRNMWILYRQEKHDSIVAKNPGLHTSKISTIISSMWRNEPTEVRAHYQMLAQEEKSKHSIQYPDYKCSPRKSSEIKKRKRVCMADTVDMASQSRSFKLPSEATVEVAQVIEQPSKTRRVNDQAQPSVSPTSNNLEQPTMVSCSPETEPVDWQPYPLFSDESSGRESEQPPEILFPDTDFMQYVDWNANDGMADWLL